MESTLAVNKPVPLSSGKRVPAEWRVLIVGILLVIAASAIALRASGMMRAVEAVYYATLGQRIAVDSATKSIGVVAEGATTPLVFRLTNRGRQPARIVGWSANCNCTVPKGLPFTLGPGETALAGALDSRPVHPEWKRSRIARCVAFCLHHQRLSSGSPAQDSRRSPQVRASRRIGVLTQPRVRSVFRPHRSRLRKVSNMKSSDARSMLRASVFCLGLALFMATGAVTIADQPYRSVRLLCRGCSMNQPSLCAGGGNTCWNLGGTNCSQVPCTVLPGGTNMCLCPP